VIRRKRKIQKQVRFLASLFPCLSGTRINASACNNFFLGIVGFSYYESSVGGYPTAFPSIILEGVVTFTSLPTVSERASQSLRICENGWVLKFMYCCSSSKSRSCRNDTLFTCLPNSAFKVVEPSRKILGYPLNPCLHHPYSQHNIFHSIHFGLCLGKNSADLFSIDTDVVWPFNAGVKAHIADNVCNRKSCNQGKLEACLREIPGFQDYRHPDPSMRRNPSLPIRPPPTLLYFGDYKRSFFCR